MKVLVLLVLLGLFAQLCESHPGGGDPGPSTSGLKKRKHDEIESECENDNMEIDSNPENSDLEDLDGLSDFEYDPEEEDPDDASADSDEEKRERPKTKKQKTEKKRRRDKPGSKRPPIVIAEKKDWVEEVGLNNAIINGEVEVTTDLNEFLKDFRGASDLEVLRKTVAGIGENKEAFKEGFNKLKPTSNMVGTDSYNYALVVEDRQTRANFEKGKQHLIYWGKGVGQRVYDHFVLASFYNHIDKTHPGKLEKPRPLLYEALSYFLRFPKSYRVGYIKFNEGLSDVDVQKYEAALIQMKFGVTETFKNTLKDSDGKKTTKYVRLLNVYEELSGKGMTNLSPAEINAIIYQAFKREGGLENKPVTFVTQEEAENLSGFKGAVDRFKELNLDKAKLDGMNNKEKIPFDWVKTFSCSMGYGGGNVPNELKLLNLLMIQQEKTSGAPIGLSKTVTEFLASFYKELGFNDPKYFKKHKSFFGNFRLTYRRVPKFIVEAEITRLEKKLSKEKEKSRGAQKILNKKFQDQIKQQADKAIHDNRIRMFRLKSAAILSIQANAKTMKPSFNLLPDAWKLMKKKFEQEENKDLEIPNFYDGDRNDARYMYTHLQVMCNSRMRTNGKLTREQCHKYFASSDREPLNLGDEGKFARFRKVLEEAVNTVLVSNGKPKVREMKFHLLLRGICNVTRIPYKVLDAETGKKVEIDNPFYGRYNKVTDGVLYYNIQRLIINHFPELLPVARITRYIKYTKGYSKCGEEYLCFKFWKPLVEGNKNGVIKCRDRLESVKDDKEAKKKLDEILDAIYKNRETKIEDEETRKAAGIDDFPKLVSDALFDYDWVDDASQVRPQTERVSCRMVNGKPKNLGSIGKSEKIDLIAGSKESAIYEPFEDEEPAEKKDSRKKKKKDESEDDSDSDSEDKAPPKSSTCPKPSTSKGSSTCPKPSTSKGSSTSSKPSTSKGSSTSSKPSTSKGTSTSSKPSTSKGSSTSSKPSTSKGSSTSSKPSTSKGTSTSSKKKKKKADSDPDYKPRG